jgi:peptide/nickel transport system substrate-binding protein
VRYNPETNEYEPRTADSITPNADFTVWTLKLKPGIKFGDGTDYNADAVMASIKRHQDPNNRTVSRGTSAIIKSMAAADPLTVTFTLTDPWAGFPYVLADKVGMIVSPAAVAKYGENFGSPQGYAGAGAGPFTVEKYAPKEALVLAKNPTFYGGDVYLDRVTFVNVVGAAATYESLKADTLQMAFVREASVVAAAKDEGYDGFSNIQQGGAVIAFNLGATVTCAGGKPEPACTGKADNTQAPTVAPTTSLKVRQALTAAIDPEVLNQRVFKGEGMTSGELFKSEFPWYPDGSAAFEYDAAEAKELVQEAKAEGWNGTVRLNCANTPENRDAALAIETMWKAAGVNVTVSTDKSTADHVAQYLVQKDFDAVCAGYNIGPDDGSVNTLNTNFKSPGSVARWGYGSPEMDALLTQARKASTEDDKREVFGQIQDLYTENALAYPYGAIEEAIFWNDSIHGVVPSQQTVVFLDKAWIAG